MEFAKLAQFPIAKLAIISLIAKSVVEILLSQVLEENAKSVLFPTAYFVAIQQLVKSAMKNPFTF